MFKEKTSRKRITTAQNAKDAATLDARHQQMLDNFTQQRNRLDDLHQKHAELSSTLKERQNDIERMRAEGSIDSPDYSKLWKSALELSEECTEISREITRLEQCTEEIEYLENTATIMFQYYELVDQQGSTATTCIPPPVAKPKGRKKCLPPPTTRNILEALQIAPASKPENEQVPGQTGAATNKSVLVDAYLAATDPTYLPEYITPEVEFADKCPACEIPLTCIQHEGIMVCTQCGCQQQLIVEQNRPLLRVPSAKEASHLSYKRINHFKEWCAQVQGKESTDIPEEVFELVLAEIKKEKITDLKKITYSKMREILKKLGINKYYEHIYYIIYRINGIPAPHFSPETEEKLCSMFKDIQAPFLKYCPPDRKNFLSYSYVLYKFMEILGFKELLKLFPLLKARSKLFVQDMVWKNITAELKWPYYSTV